MLRKRKGPQDIHMQLSDTAAPSQPGSPCDSSTSGDREKFLLKEISLKVETSKGLNSESSKSLVHVVELRGAGVDKSGTSGDQRL